MGKTLDYIKSHLKSKKTKSLEDRFAEIEDKAIVAHDKLQKYMKMEHKTLSAYVDVMQAMDNYRRNPLLIQDTSTDIGYYNELKDEARYDKKIAHMINALRSKLMGIGIDIDNMHTIAIEQADFTTWVDEINNYILHARNGNVTLNDYTHIMDMISALQSAGNKATNSVIVPMKLSLEKKGLSIFNVINYKDPIGEAHLQNTKDYEREVNSEMHRAISYLSGVANPEPYKKLYDPYGNRAYVLGQPNHKQEDEYMRIFDSVHYAIKPTMDVIYNTPLNALDVTKYPPVEDLVKYGISWHRENENNKQQ
ncbi:MAG: hypothetical protein IJW28_01095 [Clostridia bacterium]|nr:hypothetical protein [Clostridia bacterium]